MLKPMAAADADEFVLSLRRAPGGPRGTLRAVGEEDEKTFDGWIGLIGLITEYRETAVDHAMTMRSAYERINAGDLDSYAELVADDFVEHDYVPGLPATKEGMLDYFRLILSAFPDLRMEVEDLIASDDKAVARVKATGTHRGDFMGVPPTGSHIEIQLIDIMGFDGAGRVSEHWGVADMLTLMQQIGVVPTAAPA
jgi:steroid delta-isomerase-like uncharacterized protein